MKIPKRPTIYQYFKDLGFRATIADDDSDDRDFEITDESGSDNDIVSFDEEDGEPISEKEG